MKVTDIVVSLLNEELQGKHRLLRVDIPIAQGEDWTWMLLYFEHFDKTNYVREINTRLLELLSPIYAGEIVGHSRELYIFYADRDFLPQSSSKDILFQPPVGDTLPSYVRDALAFTEGHLSNFFFFKIKKEVSILNADYLARKIREETWFRARTVPYSLSHRQVEIAVGAQRKTIVPQKQQPIVCFESNRGYYAAFHNPTSDCGVKYNLYGSDGKLKTITCNRNEFLGAINFPIGEVYGFELDIPIEFDVFLPRTDEAEATVLFALKESPEYHHALRELVKQKLNEIKQKTVERLEERRQRLRKRKSVVLQIEGKEVYLGLEPTNEKEILILTAKLEKYIAQEIADFQILEHTGQLGIDALIQIRRTPSSRIEEAASVEFEYQLNNFFKHEHPILQTNYIICWTIGNFQGGTIHVGKEEIIQNSYLTVELRTNGWMKILSFDTHVIHVLPLENFPGLVVK